VAIISSDPFEALFGLQRALDDLRASSWLDASPSGGGAYPPINVFRKGDDFLILTEVPGIKKSDLDVQVRGNVVRVAGTKAIDYPDRGSLHRRERLAGAFDRMVTIPVEIDPDRVKAECRDGILALLLTRAERDKPKSIPIT
jgi:HSP20 family protein